MSQNKSGAPKTFRKGECLFREGAPATGPFVIQSGLVSVSVSTPSGPIELYQATAPQVIGLEAIDGDRIYQASAVALNDTVAQEVSTTLTQDILKTLTLGMVNKHKSILGEIKKIKLAETRLPCPPELAPKLFATIFHVASYTGTAHGETIKVTWPAFRKYSQRIFIESPIRLEQAIHLLKGMGYATLEMVKSETDPEAPDELGFVHFKNLPHLKSLSEFLRKRKTWSIDLKDPCLQAGEALLRAYGGTSGDSSGSIQVGMDEALTTLLAETGRSSFTQADLENLIADGLPALISGKPPQLTLTFNPNEIRAMFRNWKFLAKLNEWNTLGRVSGSPEPKAEPKRRTAS